ncbi:MAG: hypothetical protein IPL06_11850 [Betaproteobacteria bacterium]|nr:hypothetical protein [Betaproteobacteria bacterium]
MPREVLRLVEQHASDEAMKEDARRQFVVSMATAFEMYWREFFRFSLDKRRPTDEQLAHLTKVTVTLADVGAILGRKLTFGELFACAYSFRGPDALNAASSAVLRANAFEEFANAKITVQPIETPNMRAPLPPLKVITGRDVLKSSLPGLERCFKIRNATVHDSARGLVLSPRDVGQMELQLSTFNIMVGAFVEGRLDKLFPIARRTKSAK